jgi:O-succinylbenzoic acid--CoA ligase
MKPEKYDFAAMVPLQVENSLTGLKILKKAVVGGAKMEQVTGE